MRFTTTSMAAAAAMSAFSPSAAALRSGDPYRPSHDHFHLRLKRNQRFFVVFRSQNRMRHSSIIMRSALNNLKSNIGNNDNGSTEPARVLLERLFAQTQRLEEKMNKDPSLSEDTELTISLEVLESDLQVALLALRKKEEDLQIAERKVILDFAELNRAKQDIEQREEEITAAWAKQKKMEEDLKKASDDLASQARQIEHLKFLVEEQNSKKTHSQSLLSVKEDELDKLRNELMKKNNEAVNMTSELESRDQLLDHANEVIKKQEAKVQELQREVEEKEHALAESLHLRKAEVERLKLLEANLEKQAMEWLSTKEELKELAKQAYKNMNDVQAISEDFRRVSALLYDVRSELISSQESLASSHRRLDGQARQLERQEAELSEQKLSVMSYAESLKAAQLEVGNERTKLEVAQAQIKELEMQLLAERAVIKHLEENLENQKSQMELATQEITSLQKELRQKKMEFSDTQNFLQVKESELVEARLETQHLKSEKASLQLILKEKDGILWSAQQKLADVNDEVVELKRLTKSKEDQLIHATGKLQEKEEHVLMMQNELDNTKFKFSEATKIIERIAQLTNELVISVKDEDNVVSVSLGEETLSLQMDPDAYSVKHKQLETELEMTKESRRLKEMEFLAAQRVLGVKDEELKSVIGQLHMREKEMQMMKKEFWEDADGGKKTYTLAQGRVGNISVGDLPIEKLQLEATRLEVVAATSALRKLVDMSSQFLERPDVCIIDLDIDFVISPTEGAEKNDTSSASLDMRNGCSEEVERENAKTEEVSRSTMDMRNDRLVEAGREVAHLLSLTETLVKAAGINNTNL